MNAITKEGFEALVNEACHQDADLRHEIERRKAFDAYAEVADTAYDLFRRNFLSLREAFGLTARS